MQYIHDHPNSALQLEAIEDLSIDKFEANGILFNLLQEELLIQKGHKLRITEKGIAHLEALNEVLSRL